MGCTHNPAELLKQLRFESDLCTLLHIFTPLSLSTVTILNKLISDIAYVILLSVVC